LIATIRNLQDSKNIAKLINCFLLIIISTLRNILPKYERHRRQIEQNFHIPPALVEEIELVTSEILLKHQSTLATFCVKYIRLQYCHLKGRVNK
jgi:hypothetical protein